MKDLKYVFSDYDNKVNKVNKAILSLALALEHEDLVLSSITIDHIVKRHDRRWGSIFGVDVQERWV